MKKHNLAFIDLETTGFDPEKHEIIEIGGIVAKQIPEPGRGPKLEIVDEFEYKIKPENIETAEPGALRVNGYNEQEWIFAPNLSQVMPEVAKKTEGANLVAQNVIFDWGFLKKAYEKTGTPNKMHFHKIDVLAIAFAKFYHDEKMERFNLGALAERLGVQNDKAHTALADIRATFEVYKKLLEIE